MARAGRRTKVTGQLPQTAVAFKILLNTSI
jgi:hypothetical protein